MRHTKHSQKLWQSHQAESERTCVIQIDSCGLRGSDVAVPMYVCSASVSGDNGVPRESQVTSGRFGTARCTENASVGESHPLYERPLLINKLGWPRNAITALRGRTKVDTSPQVAEKIGAGEGSRTPVSSLGKSTALIYQRLRRAMAIMADQEI
jgi:hypothetical protein